MNFTTDQYAKFIESLKVTKEPDKFYRLLEPGKDTWQVRDEFWSHNHGGWYSIAPDRIGLIVGSGYYGQITKIDKDVIGRRTESNAKPSDLAERVKGFMRAGMDAEKKAVNPNLKAWDDGVLYDTKTSAEFRRLSEATEVKP